MCPPTTLGVVAAWIGALFLGGEVGAGVSEGTNLQTTLVWLTVLGNAEFSVCPLEQGVGAAPEAIFIDDVRNGCTGGGGWS